MCHVSKIWRCIDALFALDVLSIMCETAYFLYNQPLISVTSSCKDGNWCTFAGRMHAGDVMCLCFCSRSKFGQAKVPKLDVTASVIEDVCWLEILHIHAGHDSLRHRPKSDFQVHLHKMHLM